MIEHNVNGHYSLMDLVDKKYMNVDSSYEYEFTWNLFLFSINYRGAETMN